MPVRGFEGGDGNLVVAWALDVPASAVWEHFTDVAFLPEWLGTVRSGSFSPGEVLVVDHGGGQESTSTIKLAEPGKRLIMTWDFPGEPGSEVGVILGATATGCRLDLHHVGLGDLVSSYLPGWMTHLAFFEGSLHGSPLPLEDFWQAYGSFERLTITPDHRPGGW